jgi:broad specificity phosphatase PhoE
MKIVLIRHGESEANVAGLLSSKPSDPYGLTNLGVEQVKHAAELITENIDMAYVSPLKRTLQTADIVIDRLKDKPVVRVDNRIKEIDYGIYSGKRNNADLDKTRELQVGGNYEIRFGKNGENKYEILRRLYGFLTEVIESSRSNTTVLLVSHGSITGWLERIIIEITSSDKKHTSVSNGDVRKYKLLKKHLPNLHKLADDLEVYGAR